MRLGLTFVISLIGFFMLHYFQVNNILSIGILAVVILIAVMYPLLKVSLWETNISKIERFLVKNKSNPNFYIIYALANELDEDVRNTTERLLKKSKNRSSQALYKIGEALYFKNIMVAKNELEYIKSPSYHAYYQAIILLEEGYLEEAYEVIEKNSTQWMKNALLAELEKKSNNMIEAKRFAEKAKNNTKGLQRYLLHKTYEREFGM